MRDSGLLTGAEFEAEKRKIFGSISSHCISEGRERDFPSERDHIKHTRERTWKMTVSTSSSEGISTYSTRAERYAAGKALRVKTPRTSHREWAAASDRPDPISLLEESNRTRVPELVPIRYGRMSISPFTFLRGSAIVMASDLAKTPISGITVQLCGDAHVSNFGGFATPERDLVFDVNDSTRRCRDPGSGIRSAWPPASWSLAGRMATRLKRTSRQSSAVYRNTRPWYSVWRACVRSTPGTSTSTLRN